MEEQTIFIGSGKYVPFKNGGSAVNQSISLSKIVPGLTVDQVDPEIKEFCHTTDDGRVFLSIKAVERKQPDQWGKTHFVAIDTWKPEKSNVEKVKEVFDGEECPF